MIKSCECVILSMDWAETGKRNGPEPVSNVTQGEDSILKRLLFPFFGGLRSRKINYEASAMVQCIIFA